MANLVNCFIDDAAGSTALEYSLIALLIAVSIALPLMWVSSPLEDVFPQLITQFH